MRYIHTLVACLLCCMGMAAQNPNTLVIKNTNGSETRIPLANIQEMTFEEAELPQPGQCTVTKVLNLTPNFFTLSGVQEGDKLTAGETATVTLTAAGNLTGFSDYHFMHIHLHVGDQVIVPAVPENFQNGAESIEISFTVPEGDCEIVAAYAVQQQFIDGGYTMTMEEHPNVKLYGVSPNEHYKYFDSYLLTDEAFVITKAEYKMGDGEWTNVSTTNGCSLERVEDMDNLYNISIRPDYKNVTGDVVLRITGEQHHRYNITWVNATGEYLDMEKSILPAKAIDGDQVISELWVKDAYYLDGATASDGTEVETISRAYTRFTMPAGDVTITLNIKNKVPVSYTASEHITDGVLKDQKNWYAGVPTTVWIPGEEIYLFVGVEDGYKPLTATTDSGKVFTFENYGPTHDGEKYVSSVKLDEDATSMSVSVQCGVAYNVSCAQNVMFNGGNAFCEGETVTFSIGVAAGKEIDTVTAVDASGNPVAVTVDGAYGSFVMPASNVTVTVTYKDLSSEDQVSVIAYFNEDEYSVSSSTNYDWDFAEGFNMGKGATFYLSVFGYYGEMFYVGVKIGDTVTVYPAEDADGYGEYSFGKSLVASGNVVIKVGPTESSVSF